jgi:hypothetical protein
VTLISPILALIWGLLWALALQYVPLGRFLAVRRSWLAVVIGVAVDLLLLRPVLSQSNWLQVASVLGASSVGMILRSLFNEWRDHQEILARAERSK